MKIARTLPKNESDFILGKTYIKKASKGLKISSEKLLIDLEKYILNPTMISDREKEFFNYIIELMSLTFIMYKWGLLLFHLENRMFGNFVVVFDIENSYHLAYEQASKIVIKNLETDKDIFATIESKSLMAQLLIELISKNSGVAIADFETDLMIYDGSRVSYSEDRFNAQKDEIDLIRSNFFEYKNRLEELQQIFIDHFGNIEELKNNS